VRKDLTICFRTSDGLRKALEKIAAKERRSLSALIENVLHDSLEKREALPQGMERRIYPRKQVFLPAFISLVGAEGSYPSIIQDVSLGGMKLSFSKEWGLQIRQKDETKHMNVLFALPEEKSLMAITCSPNRVHHVNGDMEVGAIFAECAFPNYQRLQSYLLQ
jgi:hypothetical protein